MSFDHGGRWSVRHRWFRHAPDDVNRYRGSVTTIAAGLSEVMVRRGADPLSMVPVFSHHARESPSGPGAARQGFPIEPSVLLLLRRDHQHGAGGVRAHMSRSVAQRDIEQPAFAVASDHQQVSLYFGCDLDDDVSGTAEAKGRDGKSSRQPSDSFLDLVEYPNI